jgi:hypothetical protein
MLFLMASLAQQFEIVNQFMAQPRVTFMMQLQKVRPPTAMITLAISELHQIAPHVAPFRAAKVCLVFAAPDAHALFLISSSTRITTSSRRRTILRRLTGRQAATFGLPLAGKIAITLPVKGSIRRTNEG